MIEYKGYIGKVEFEGEVPIFHGEVINTRDVITFRGESVSELPQASMIPSMNTWPFVRSVGRPLTRHFSDSL